MTPAAYPRVFYSQQLAPSQTERVPLQKRSHRAGPALPSYLALHHAGFSVPPVLPPERWALTPPFHPYQTQRACSGRSLDRFVLPSQPYSSPFRRRLTGFPVRCHRASLRRRYILCGTFRSAPGHTGFRPRFPFAPPGVTRRVALSRVPLTALRSQKNNVRSSFKPSKPILAATSFVNAERSTCLRTVSGLSSRSIIFQ